MYHRLVRPIPNWAIVGGAGGAIVGFTMLGLIRAGVGGDARLVNPFLHTTEFDVLFGNAVELARAVKRNTLGQVPVALHFADLAALVPQQFVPFVKIEPAAWFANRFYPQYAAMGGGLAYGTIAEAMIGGGSFGAAARGAALGAVFAAIHTFYARRARSYWAVVFYVWATSLCYQSYRATTFLFLTMFVYRFLPVVVLVKALTTMLDRFAPGGSRPTVTGSETLPTAAIR
jgi:hypothetical protein